MSTEAVRLKRLRTPPLVAPTLSGSGEIEYDLLIDNDGRLYVQLTKNSGTGNLSKLAFPVHSLQQELAADAQQLTGLDTDGILGPDTNRNSVGFVKAVANHLLA